MIEYDDNKDADTSWILLHKATRFDENIFYREFGVSFAEWRKSTFSNYLTMKNIMKEKIKRLKNLYNSAKRIVYN